MVHTHVCGPISPETLAGERYFTTLVDDHSRFIEVRLLKKKSEVAEKIKKLLEIKPHNTIRKIGCDKARVYFK